MIGALCGMLLGDGYAQLQPKGKNAYLSIHHCKRQESYLDYKVKILSKLCRTRKSEEKAGQSVRLWTQCHPMITEVRDWFYKSGQKGISDKILYHLTPLGLALWYLDDGYLGFIKKPYKALLNFIRFI